MMPNLHRILVIVLTFILRTASAQAPSFTAPDRVCTNTPVTIANTSVGGTTYYWSFCDADLNQIPQATNLGNIGGSLSWPVYMDIVSENGNYYGLLVEHYPGSLVRLDFGNSLLNTPTATNLGNLGVLNPAYGSEDIQVIKNNGSWYALIVGGDPISQSNPQIVQVKFGASITNPNPVGTDWGNLGNLKQPVGLYVFSDNNNWYGFTVNATNNTITRFAFGNNLDVPPNAVNLGNPGGLFDYPCGITPLKDPATGDWHVFITNGNFNSPSALERLDFGPSLLNNNPAAVNLGNPGNVINTARDLKIVQQCDQFIGFIADGTSNDLIRLNFNSGILGVPTATSLGNIGNFDFAHSLSKLFRIGADLYTFVPNVYNYTITRVRFAGCTSSTIPNFSGPNPPVISYSQPGTYHINLIMDDGLSTQSSFCKEIIVEGLPPFSLGNDTTLCQGDSVVLKQPADPSLQFRWQDGSNGNQYIAHTSGKYFLALTDAAGCTNSDSVNISFLTLPTVAIRADTTICQWTSLPLTSAVQNADSLQWTPAAGLSDPHTASPVASPSGSTQYILTAFDQFCHTADTVSIGVLPAPVLAISPDTLVCRDSIIQLHVSGANTYGWFPASGISDPTSANPLVVPDTTHYYYVRGTGLNSCSTLDSVLVTAKGPAGFRISPLQPKICFGDSIQLTVHEVNGAPGDSWQWLVATANPGSPSVTIWPAQTSVYQAVGFDNICKKQDTLSIEVRVMSLPTVTVSKSNDIGCVLGEATLTATGGASYSWFPASTLSDPLSPAPVARTDTSTLYYVLATGENGCTTLDSIRLDVVKGTGIGFPVANAFTPNGDGANDCFGIKYWGYVGKFEMAVYDRWGRRVFYTQNPGECWDGTAGGKPQPAGTYVYTIKAFTLCGEAVKKGTVLLIR